MSAPTLHRAESRSWPTRTKLSDYVMRFVAETGVRHVFMIPGGGAMHLNDSLRREEGLRFVCNLHEQASAIAAEAYCRVTGNLGVALVTTGPGGTNAVTGVACAWLDSTPCLFISGQVKRSDLATGTGLRQLGVQEIDIVSVVGPLTKYAVTVTEPTEIRYHLEKALHLARTGRPGPVWIDIPLDVQASEIAPESLEGFRAPLLPENGKGLKEAAARTVELLSQAERPVLLAGNGIRIAMAIPEFIRVAEALGIPVLTTCPGLDLIPDSHPLLIGRPGAIAPRGANFALQNSDLLISIGARLDMALVGYSHRNFARCAKKAIVDIDPAEIAKLDMDIAVRAPYDAKGFLLALEEALSPSISEGALAPRSLRARASGSATAARPLPPAGGVGDRREPGERDSGRCIQESTSKAAWLQRCLDWKARYPLVTDDHRNQADLVSTYAFTEELSQALQENETLVVGSSGAAIELVFLCLKVKPGQRIFHNRGTGSMGLGLPQAIGACFANGGERTVLVEGDGSLQLNIQELQTVVTHWLPIKMFILNNQGYASIRLSQNRHFAGLIGADEASGLGLPDIRKVAEAYGIPTVQIRNHAEMAQKIADVLALSGPVLCEVMTTPDEVRTPSLSSRQREDGSMTSSPLEDLWPFLPREEFLANMIVPPLED